MKEKKEDAFSVLKAKFDKEKIEDLIKYAVNYVSDMRTAQKSAIDVLWYLERTGRYKEYPGYEKADFRQFILDVIQMSPKQYHGARIGYYNYPEETAKYGVGVVTKIRKVCGDKAVKGVFKEIKAAESKRKTPLPVEQVHAIIEQHKLPPKAPKTGVITKKVADEAVNWEAKYHAEHKLYMQAVERIKELEGQLERAQAAIKRYAALKEKARGMVDAMKGAVSEVYTS